MKRIQAPFISVTPTGPSLCELSSVLDTLPRHPIDIVPWPSFPYKPDVGFVIGYDDKNVCVKFYVSEKFARATYGNPNDPVYKDSCVEFFIALDGEDEYYNFEFNCAGTCLLGFGKGLDDRLPVPAEVIRSIRHLAIIKPSNSPEASISWELTVMIPLHVFYFHKLKSLKGKKCRINFYKCGDDLPEPHFLAWNDIHSEAPDFHIPHYFGSMYFSEE